MADRSLPRLPGAIPPLFTVVEVHEPDDDVLIDPDISIIDLARCLASGGFALRYDHAKDRLIVQRADLGAARAAYLRMRLRLRSRTWRLP